MSLIVAVDGPAGSGKSSVSKAVARHLGFHYLDTGAAYRTLTWIALAQGTDLESEQAVAGALDSSAIPLPTDPDNQTLMVDGRDVTEEIRTERVSASVSKVARHPSVRQALNEMFRAKARSELSMGIIVEGRDITTVVFPDAPVRILLTADESVRVARRVRELGSEGDSIATRDAADRKVVDFLTAAEGVHTIDSTDLSFDDTVVAMQQLVEEALSVGEGRSGN